LRYKDFVMTFETEQWEVSPMIKSRLTDIREGRKEDKHGWMVQIS
jgi:branched-chain amino acid aminotransferase